MKIKKCTPRPAHPPICDNCHTSIDFISRNHLLRAQDAVCHPCGTLPPSSLDGESVQAVNSSAVPGSQPHKECVHVACPACTASPHHRLVTLNRPHPPAQPRLGCILLTREADRCWSQSISPPTWALGFKPCLAGEQGKAQALHEVLTCCVAVGKPVPS